MRVATSESKSGVEGEGGGRRGRVVHDEGKSVGRRLVKRPRVHGRVRRRRGGGEEGGEESGESETLAKLFLQPRAWLKPRPA